MATTQNEIYKLVWWALTIAIAVSGYFLKETVEKIDKLQETVASIDKRIYILEDRQIQMFKSIERNADDIRTQHNKSTSMLYQHDDEDDLPDTYPLKQHLILKPKEVRFSESNSKQYGKRKKAL